MNRPKTAWLLLLSILLFNSGCAFGPATEDGPAVDLNTPEGAILSLEEAYRNQDIEAAIACRDFAKEAEIMLSNLSDDIKGDPEVLAKTTEVLELGFRAEMNKMGFPDFRGIKSKFSDKQPFQGRDDIVQLVETCTDKDGNETVNKMHVAKSADGWKVITILDPNKIEEGN